MKKLTVIVVLICTIGMIGICLGQYDSGTQYPWNRAERWYCAEIDMTIHFLVSSEGETPGSSFGVCKIDGQVYEMEIGFQGDTVGFLMDEDKDGIYETVLDGIWTYQNQNMVITDYEEELFGGLCQELVFTPMKEG